MLLLRKRNILMKVVNKAIWDLPTPSKFSIWWKFGSLMGMCLMVQLMTGMFLAMHYMPDINLAFISVSQMCRDVKYGWLIRNIHTNGGSMFFMCLYVHIGRSLYYGSYMKAITWKMGMVLFLLSMLTAFFGYVLPWGQMSFWAATVMTNLVTAIPYMGVEMVQWIWGGYSVDKPTLQRFFVFHFIAPFILIVISMLHLLFLHKTGSKNPLGLPSNFDNKPFHPFFTSKDVVGFAMLMFFFSTLALLTPTILSDPENFIPAKPLVTPPHIQPEWYFLFVYAMLRSIPKKLGGVMALVSTMLVLFLIPLLHFSIQGSSLYRPLNQMLFWLTMGNFVILMWIGSSPVEPPFILVGQMSSAVYFMKFLILFPIMSYLEKMTQNFIARNN